MQKKQCMVIDTHLQHLVDTELEWGETVLWTGQPDPKREALPTFAIYLFAVPWTAFSLQFVAMMAREGSLSIGTGLFMVPFLAIGIAMLYGPFGVYSQSRHRVYVITRQRILIIEAGKARTVTSYGQGNIGELKRTERVDGSGDLTFAHTVEKDSDGDWRKKDISLSNIPDVRQVENLIRDTFKAGAW